MDEPKKCPDDRLDSAVSALLTARSFGDAAKALGVSERSLRRWRADKRLAVRLAAARADALAAALDGLHAAAAKAVGALRAGLSRQNGQSVRTQAAVAMLKLLMSRDAGAALTNARRRDEEFESMVGDEEHRKHLEDQWRG